MTLTIPEIYQRLRLQDPDEFARERMNARLRSVMFVHEHLVEEYLARGTGRTTRMLVAALRDLSAGQEVLIVGKTFVDSRRMHGILVEWAGMFRLNTRKVSFEPWDRFALLGRITRGNYSVHVDHYVREDHDVNRFIADHGF